MSAAEHTHPASPRSPFCNATILPLAAVAPILILGCASPGPPRPPSLHLPAIVTDLSARRVGPDVVLRWTTPSDTTDNLPVPHNLSAELCRSTPPQPKSTPAQPPTPTCLPRLAIQPGPGTLTDTLPSDLRSGPLRLLAYQIRILNPSGRAAGPSTDVFAIAGPDLPPVVGLHLTPRERAIQLEWQPSPSDPGSTVDLDRTAVAPAAPTGPAPKPLPEVHLRIAERDAGPAGATDIAVADTDGQTYRYTAQRVRSLTLAGHALELRSLPSAPEEVVVRDTFPPRAPQGLAAVPSLPTADQPAASIDLSWEPNTEPDLAGYNIYRAPAGPGPSPAFTRLNPTPVAAPALRDRSAQLGHRYLYRVTAVDRAGNESQPSYPIEEDAAQP